MATSASAKRAGIYARVSMDRRQESRSVDQQDEIGAERAQREGWAIAEIYSDRDRSASRFAKKARPDWDRLLADLPAGKLDLIWLWESSRGDRTLESWAAMLSRCREHGVLIYVETHGRLYDMSNARDWRTLAEDGVDNAYESEKTSLRIRRDKACTAAAGRPDGRVTFGYQRHYDPDSGKLVGQGPDPEKAPIAVAIITRIAKGDPISMLAAEYGLSRNYVRRIATNPAYIGKREHGGQLHDAIWPEIVDEATFWAAQRVLSDPARKTTRPGRVKWMVSYFATCGPAGCKLSVRQASNVGPIYLCSHVGIRADWLERFVSELVIARLSQPDIFPALMAADDAAVIAARGEAEQLRARLEDFYDQAAAGDLTAAGLARVEARLLPQIAEAEKRAEMAATPPALRSLLEPDADVRERWEGLSPAARKDVVRVLVEAIIVHPTDLGRNSTYEAIDERRIEVRWSA